MRSNIRKKKFSKGFIYSTVLSVILVILVIIKLMPNFKTIPYSEYLEGVYPQKITTVFQDGLVSTDNFPIYQDNEVFLPVDFVSKFIDEYIFWDSSENILTITTKDKLIRMKTDDLEYFINNQPFSLDLPIYNIDSIAYLPSSILEEVYNIDINYHTSSKIVTIDEIGKPYKVGTISKDKTSLRYDGSIKSPNIKKLNSGETVVVLDTVKNFTKVRSSDGYIGWVKSKFILNISEKITEVKLQESPDTNVWQPKNGERVNLIFDQINNVKQNKNETKRITHDGVNVLSPTWFSFKDTSGDIKNIADKSYVDWAHENGYQVWGLITDNFDAEISHAVLSSTNVREHVIKQLLALASLYNLDGINIDFENVPKDDGEYFVQFIRELSPLLKEQGLILSIDTFVPKPWTKHYNRKEISKIADYIIVMGYDQHYAGSKTSGSVASLEWSIESIESSLKEGIPKEKLILGVPFYTRVWVEDGDKLTSKAYGMAQAYEFMEGKGAKVVFDEETGQNYSEVVEDGKTYKVWYEDALSMEKRANLVSQYDIAGIGAWKRGLDSEGIDKIISESIK